MHIDKPLARVLAIAVCGAAALAVGIGAAKAQTLTSDSAAQAIAIAGGGGGSAGGTQRLVTVPNIIAPSFYGANPCGNSASAGAGWLGTGISFGGQWTEQECRDQEWFRFLNMAGQPRVAAALVCRNYPRLRAAYEDAGIPCLREHVAAVAAAVVAPMRQVSATPLPAYCSVPGIANPECLR